MAKKTKRNVSYNQTPYTEAEKMRYFKDHLQRTIARAKEVVEAFKTSLTNDPLSALSWSSDLFCRAADNHVCVELLRVVERSGGISFAALIAHAHDNVVSCARDMSSSTSPVSNHTKLCLKAAWAQMYEALRSIDGGYRLEVKKS